jgi:adenylate cyclase
LGIFKLQSPSGEHSVEIAPSQTIVVGRAVTTDLPVYDPTVSRRHAELIHAGDGLTVRDLGSSNGTFVNGSRISESHASDGDVVTFGKVAFNLTEVADATPPPHAEAFAAPQSAPEATIIRQLPVDEGPDSLEQQVARLSGEMERDASQQKETSKLSLLLDISKELAKQQDVDRLLDKVVDITFQVMSVDRVSILMVAWTGCPFSWSRQVPAIWCRGLHATASATNRGASTFRGRSHSDASTSGWRSSPTTPQPTTVSRDSRS